MIELVEFLDDGYNDRARSGLFLNESLQFDAQVFLQQGYVIEHLS